MAAGGSLVGRDSEQTALEGLLTRATKGSLAAAFIEGEAGIGKTGLTSALIERARTRRFKIFRAAAAEIDRDRPFGAIADALNVRSDSSDPVRVSIDDLLLGPADAEVAPSPDLRYRILGRLLDVVEEESRSAPVLLVLEDLHWSDPATLLMVHRLITRVEGLPLALVCTFRPLPRPAELVQVLEEARGAGAVLLKLGSLEDDDVAELVRRTVRADPSPALLRQASRAAGNALFVLELIGSMMEEGAIRVSEGIAGVEDSTLAPPLRVTILRRLSFLPPSTLELLRMAAVLGSSFSLPDLSTVTAQSIERVAAEIDPALVAGVVGAEGSRLAFRHDLVREAIHEDLSEPVRAGLHLHAGRTLASADAPPSQVAAHLVLGAEQGDEEAIDWIKRAALEAAPRSPVIATDLLRHALELRPAGIVETEIKVELSRVLLWSGRFAEALQLSNELLEQDAAGSLDGLRYAVGRVLVYQGNVNDSVARVEEALSAEHGSDMERARMIADLALRKPLQGQLEAADRAAEDALRGAERLGDGRVESTALSGISLVAGLRGRFTEAARVAKKAGARAGKDIEESVELLQPRFFLGFALLEADRLEEGRDEFLHTLQLAEKLGTPWALPLSHAALALARFLAGQWDDALADADTSIALAQELDMENWLLLSHSVRASILARRGDTSGADVALADGCGLIARRGPAQLGFDRFLWSWSTVLEMKGDAPAALSHLEATRTFLEDLGFVGRRRDVCPDLVRLAVSEGRHGLARSAAGSLEELVALDPIPSVRGAACRCEGFLSEKPEPHLKAVECYRASGRPLETALSCESAGEAVVKGGGSEGIALITEAAVIFESLGATQDIARVERMLRALGVKRGAKGQRRRPKTGWDSLTKTEQQVARLAAEGLTNPQIGARLYVSRRTVATHLSHIYQKLGIASRVELAAASANKATEAPAT